MTQIGTLESTAFIKKHKFLGSAFKAYYPVPESATAFPPSESDRENASFYQPRIQAKINGTTIVASDSIMNLGVSSESLPQVIFSFGTAPEYEP
jgi:hypothetical protein